MSATATPTDSPVQTPIQPLHNPSQAAHVVVPQAPLGNATNGGSSLAAGMGAKALLAKKMAKSVNPTFISPTDNLMTPVSQKLNASKKKHFTKGANPMKPLFATKEASGSSEEETSPREEKMNDDENPF
ncbi:hypothetical protein BXZ70DRAFT_410271 [Cristinia sonorae]|uniref:Uncharacterized protein n=1 Tax=Cristinia sonorae TaxID=1940300 RepID=A0A8K0UXG7_9AGAR|nr:hypothetical protein BXZ70DRAFT_410271 [Cristinia sonorae]